MTAVEALAKATTKPLSVIRRLYSRYRYRGFVGPKYPGWVGKARLLAQEWLGHREVVLFAEPERWSPTTDVNHDVRIEVFTDFEDTCQHLEAVEKAYARDMAAQWQAHFSWGHWLVLAFVGTDVAAFVWIQSGNQRDRCYYMQLQEGEYRLVNGGVLPQYRGQRVHTSRHVLLLKYLFGIGARRVYIDAFEDNVYSWRGQLAAGYREFGRIVVARSLSGKKYARWVEDSDG
jgi:RimJ/RimL family protein N-acetyltransferase